MCNLSSPRIDFSPLLPKVEREIRRKRTMAAYGKRNNGSGEDRDKDRHHIDRNCDRSDKRTRRRDEDDDNRIPFPLVEEIWKGICETQKASNAAQKASNAALKASYDALKAVSNTSITFQRMEVKLQKLEDALLPSDKFPFTVTDNAKYDQSGILYEIYAVIMTNSGFDMEPAVSTMFARAAMAATGQPRGALPVMPVQAMTQQASTRQARRVYVGGISPTATEQSVATFFNQVMAAIGGNNAVPGDAVVQVYINHEKKLAFVEMRSVEAASNAMALDGIKFEGAPVRVGRPSDYNPSLASAFGPSTPNPNLNLAAVGLTPASAVGLTLASAGELKGPDCIFVGGLPYNSTEAQIREVLELESFGRLRSFNLVRDRETGNSKGYAFCIYRDVSVTDKACAAFNGAKMGDKTLTVRRANQGQVASQPIPEQGNALLLHAQQQIALQRPRLQPGAGALATKVVCLTQAVSEDELKDDENYKNIEQDMREEGGKFGTLMNVVIPRPNPNGEPSPGVGKVFLEYADVEGSSNARTNLDGRKYDGNSVATGFYPENKFSQGEYDQDLLI